VAGCLRVFQTLFQRCACCTASHLQPPLSRAWSRCGIAPNEKPVLLTQTHTRCVHSTMFASPEGNLCNPCTRPCAVYSTLTCEVGFDVVAKPHCMLQIHTHHPHVDWWSRCNPHGARRAFIESRVMLFYRPATHALQRPDLL
jgi:hypothetical protein